MTELQRAPWHEWETIKIIGQGSFGTVYEIQRNVLGDVEKSAMKVISIPQNPGDVEELYSEGYDDESVTATFKSHLKSMVEEYQLMQKLDGSANIVNCKDIRYLQHDDGIGWDLYIRMELLTPLTKALPVIPKEETVVQIGKDICNALVLCNKYGIVHRDIKPQNIFVSPNGDYKLGDFGVAKTVEKTMGGTKVGTYTYMAPEVYNNQPYGNSADIYSLGLVMYWLLNARRMPFMPSSSSKLKIGQGEEARYRRLSGEKLPEPTRGSPELRRIVLKACAYDPRERYLSAAAMLEALNNIGSGRILTSSDEIIPDDEITIGPPFSPVKELPNNPDLTFGPKFSHKPTPITLEPSDSQPAQPVRKKKMWWMIGLPVVLAITICLLFVKNSLIPNEHNPTMKVPTAEADGASATADTSTWSEWLSGLPSDVNSDQYIIEEEEIFRTRTAESTTSSEPTMDGWELYNTEESGNWGEPSPWSNTPIEASETRKVETQTVYKYRDKETTTSSNPTMSGWVFSHKTAIGTTTGSWSDWSETPISASETLEVETEPRYSYRDIITTQEWSEWGPPSTWQDTAVEANDSTKVETQTVYRYYYFYCPVCGGHEPFWGYKSDCGQYTIQQSDWNIKWSTIPYSQTNPQSFSYTPNKKYTTSLGDGQIWIFDTANLNDTAPGTWNEGAGDYVIKTQYRYYTREKKDIRTPSDWSEYSSVPVTASSTREVSVKPFYKSREIIPTYEYHFYRLGDWSDWSTNVVSATSNREVVSELQYRYSEMLNQTIYYFRKWGEWSDWEKTTGNIPVTSDTMEVEAETKYRYRTLE